jgi:hypothetical protein
MEEIYAVYELNTWEFWGTYSECIDYVNRNDFKDAMFTIVKL